MVEQVWVDLTGGRATFAGSVFRYDVVGRMRRVCEGQQVGFLAFGFAPDHLRLVVDGPPERVREALRGLKVGTVRAAVRWGASIVSGAHQRTPTGDLESAVVWAHETMPPGADPLSTPWSSHRDLLGFRRAAFFDPGPVLLRVDPKRVHVRCGGGALPDGWPPAGHDVRDLTVLLRVAAAILGVLPADRRCFRVFVHLARAQGYPATALARALFLTPRRVRQLAAESEPLLALAQQTAAHPLLSRVP